MYHPASLYGLLCLPIRSINFARRNSHYDGKAEGRLKEFFDFDSFREAQARDFIFSNKENVEKTLDGFCISDNNHHQAVQHTAVV